MERVVRVEEVRDDGVAVVLRVLVRSAAKSKSRPGPPSGLEPKSAGRCRPGRGTRGRCCPCVFVNSGPGTPFVSCQPNGDATASAGFVDERREARRSGSRSGTRTPGSSSRRSPGRRDHGRGERRQRRGASRTLEGRQRRRGCRATSSRPWRSSCARLGVDGRVPEVRLRGVVDRRAARPSGARRRSAASRAVAGIGAREIPPSRDDASARAGPPSLLITRGFAGSARSSPSAAASTASVGGKARGARGICARAARGCRRRRPRAPSAATLTVTCAPKTSRPSTRWLRLTCVTPLCELRYWLVTARSATSALVTPSSSAFLSR